MGVLKEETLAEPVNRCNPIFPSWVVSCVFLAQTEYGAWGLNITHEMKGALGRPLKTRGPH